MVNPNQVNAHPHTSHNGKFTLVHNGIIENFSTLRDRLTQRGYQFQSETDTEVLVTLIEDIADNGKLDFADAVRAALAEVIGAYAIVVISKDNPESIVAARKGSPLVVGIERNEVNSSLPLDATPIIEYTNRVIYLNDGEVAEVNREELVITTVDNVVQTPYIQELKMELEQLEKEGLSILC